MVMVLVAAAAATEAAAQLRAHEQADICMRRYKLLSGTCSSVSDVWTSSVCLHAH